MKHQTIALLTLMFIALVGTVQAQNKPDPTGVWKWTVEFNGNSFEQTLTLKLEGDQLTGFMLGRNDQEWPISEASFKDGVVSFKVVRERNGRTFTSLYTGQIDGDTI